MRKSAFSVERAEDSPGFLLWRTTVAWQRQIKKALEPYGISHAQFVVMAVAMWLKEHKQDTTQVAIASRSGLDKMTVSQALKKLVQLQLVNRIESRDDSRAKTVQFSEKGALLIVKLISIVEQIDYNFFQTVEPGNKKMLIIMLQKLSGD